MLLGSSLEIELDGVIIDSEDGDSVDSVLDSSIEDEVDGTSLSCEVLENSVEAAEELDDSLVDKGPSVLSWLVGVEISTVLVENSDPVGVDVASSPLLVPETLAELSLALSKLLDSEPVKDDEASGVLVWVCIELCGSVEVPAEVSELSKELGWLLVSMVLPDSVDSAVLVNSVESSDVPLLESVLSSSLLVLDSVVDGPGVGPEAGVASVEMLP